jgi:hypothetical protein
LLLFFSIAADGLPQDNAEALWSLQPIVRLSAPVGLTKSKNPIDAFIAEEHKARGLRPVGPADRRTLLRRVFLDLIGLPPTLAEQDAFLRDTSPGAYEKVVDRLLASPQHGVRYARHWLDVLRYADVDEGMLARPGIYLWRDWVIRALNDDLPYDQFVRAQLTGYRTTARTTVSVLGERQRIEPRPEDMFALGFLARGQSGGSAQEPGGLAMAAAETVASAFMGLTAGCAKCHDHMFDPITQREFYAMKALFDPLVLRKVTLGSPAEIFAHAHELDAIDGRRAELEGPMQRLIAPYKKRLYEERVELLPPDVRAIVRKPEGQRTGQEQKIADDYFPVLRIDPAKIMEVMPPEERKQYADLERRIKQTEQERLGAVQPVFWTVEEDAQKKQRKSYILTSGDPDRPEKNHEVGPGWPFAVGSIDFGEGRIKAFSDWLTTASNPLFARVAVNRLWQWHFGEGLHKTPNDFGTLGGAPVHPHLLDWLASEFVRCGFSMRQMHRLLVTSETYKTASVVDPDLAISDLHVDPADAFLWHFRLQRLEAEPIWDSILAAAGTLDTSIGGPSFDPTVVARKGQQASPDPRQVCRRSAYMVRGYSSQRDVVPHFLQAFDVDDGRTSCPSRTQTVTAPQALFMMNNPVVDRACTQFAERLKKEAGGDLGRALDLGYRIALARPATASEITQARACINHDQAGLKHFAWLLFNLDEFVYVR